MNNSILKEVLLFKDSGEPTFSKIQKLLKEIRKYENEYSALIIFAKRGNRSKILNILYFWNFISEFTGKTISSFEDVSKLLTIPESRAEAIKIKGDSKAYFTQVFHKTILFKNRGEKPQIYMEFELHELSNISQIVAVENGESFLNIEKVQELENFDNFIYLGGTGNSLTRDFLANKDVLFFIDFDIISLNIFEDFKSFTKSIFIPSNLETLLKKFGNEKLYLKQRPFLRNNYEENSIIVLDFILKYSLVLEQEILHNETY